MIAKLASISHRLAFESPKSDRLPADGQKAAMQDAPAGSHLPTGFAGGSRPNKYDSDRAAICDAVASRSPPQLHKGTQP
jgi:hypothetical protein